MDEGPSSVFSSELTYGHRTGHVYSSLAICFIMFRGSLGKGCFAWSRGHIIQRDKLEDLFHEHLERIAYTLLETKCTTALKTCGPNKSSNSI